MRGSRSRPFPECLLERRTPWPAEATQAHLDLEAAESVAMHFGTFQLTIEGIDEPVRALAEACREKGIPPSQFRAIGFGASVRL